MGRTLFPPETAARRTVKPLISDEYAERLADHCWLRAAGNFRPEIERQIRVCVADPRARIGIGAGAQGDAAEAILDELLGCKLERLDALAQLLNVRVGVQPQLAPQCSKRLDEVGPDRTGYSRGNRQRLGGRLASARGAGPQTAPDRRPNRSDPAAPSALRRPSGAGRTQARSATRACPPDGLPAASDAAIRGGREHFDTISAQMI